MQYRDDVYQNAQPPQELAFPAEEYKLRLQRLRNVMSVNGVDCLFITSPESMYYISGYICMWYQTESPIEWPASNGIAVHVDHDHLIHFESEREAVLTRTFTEIADTRLYPKDSYRNGTDFIASELKAAGWLNGNIGLEYWSMRPNPVIHGLNQVAFEAAGATVIEASQIVRELRWVKSEAEMDCLQKAAVIAETGIQAAIEIIQPGMTELEVQGEILRALTAAGGEMPAMMLPVISGKKSNATHAVSTRKRLQKGETLFVDLAGVYNRYHINIARTFCLGEPAEDIRATANSAAAVMDIVKDCLRPNLPVRELNEKVKDYYESAGLWESRGWIGGYEMGIAFLSDWVGNFVYDPLAEKNSTRLFEPGTVVNHESQIFLPRHSGQYFMVESLLFFDDRVELATESVPYELIIID
jgi:Xaa-Pro aminopeptidase